MFKKIKGKAEDNSNTYLPTNYRAWIGKEGTEL